MLHSLEEWDQLWNNINTSRYDSITVDKETSRFLALLVEYCGTEKKRGGFFRFKRFQWGNNHAKVIEDIVYNFIHQGKGVGFKDGIYLSKDPDQERHKFQLFNEIQKRIQKNKISKTGDLYCILKIFWERNDLRFRGIEESFRRYVETLNLKRKLKIKQKEREFAQEAVSVNKDFVC